MFTGNVLHGVIPGRGQVPEGNNARRVTFMVAFWEDIKGHVRDNMFEFSHCYYSKMIQ